MTTLGFFVGAGVGFTTTGLMGRAVGLGATETAGVETIGVAMGVATGVGCGVGCGVALGGGACVDAVAAGSLVEDAPDRPTKMPAVTSATAPAAINPTFHVRFPTS